MLTNKINNEYIDKLTYKLKFFLMREKEKLKSKQQY